MNSDIVNVNKIEFFRTFGDRVHRGNPCEVLSRKRASSAGIPRQQSND